MTQLYILNKTSQAIIDTSSMFTLC